MAVEVALRARVRLGRVLVVERTGSTSADLVAAAVDPEAWPDRSVLVADHQTHGRGRAGRTWETPAGSALTASILLRPRVPVDTFGWLPLLGGLAVVRALETVGAPAVLKWPNDVLLAGATDVPGWGTWRKVAGVLGDLAGEAAVIGIGVNVEQSELPVPHATSLLAAGYRADRVALLGEVLAAFLALEERWRESGGDASAAGLAQECVAACVTLGTRVRVHQPAGILEGTATGLSADGALLVKSGGREHVVLAGDVHSR